MKSPLALISPITSSFLPGSSVPIPTFFVSILAMNTGSVLMSWFVPIPNILLPPASTSTPAYTSPPAFSNLTFKDVGNVASVWALMCIGVGFKV